MKILAFLSLILSLSAIAGTTCPKSTKAEYTCESSNGSQYDFCKKKNSSYQIRINGEVYSQNAKKDYFDGLVQFQGTNYEQVRFITELDLNSRSGSLTEVKKHDMPIGDAIELSCIKNR